MLIFSNINSWNYLLFSSFLLTGSKRCVLREGDIL